jgi:N-acetylneuraminic acid mutarotase
MPGLITTNEGYGYNPAENKWRSLTLDKAPSPRFDAFAAWVGSEMLVFGGRTDLTALGNGDRYDPSSDMWSNVSMMGSPSERTAQAGRSGWAGGAANYAVLVGGLDTAQNLKIDGRRYNAPDNSWQVIPSIPSGSSHERGVGVWTGAELILWGGLNGATLTNTGERYLP